MLRTIRCFAGFFTDLMASLPALSKVKSLDKAGKILEKDKLVREFTKKWASNFIGYTGSTVEVTGAENIPHDRAVVFVSNHQSYYDIPLLMGFITPFKAFIAKKDIGKVPILRTWMKYMNCVFITRNNPRKSLMAINQGAEFVKKGYSMVIFPEGTRTTDGTVQDFKPGSLKLAIRAGAPIVPVTIDGAINMMKKGSIRIRPAHIRIIISPPIYFDAHVDSHALAKQIHDEIESKLMAATTK